jgi:hypothetical protein
MLLAVPSVAPAFAESGNGKRKHPSTPTSRWGCARAGAKPTHNQTGIQGYTGVPGMHWGIPPRGMSGTPRRAPNGSRILCHTLRGQDSTPKEGRSDSDINDMMVERPDLRKLRRPPPLLRRQWRSLKFKVESNEEDRSVSRNRSGVKHRGKAHRQRAHRSEPDTVGGIPRPELGC